MNTAHPNRPLVGHVQVSSGLLFYIFTVLALVFGSMAKYGRTAGLLFGVFFLSLPLWLPRLVVLMRFWAFRFINGPSGMLLPTEKIAGDTFVRVYNSPAANIRSIQTTVGLSDFFWYLLAPVTWLRKYRHPDH